MSKSRNQPDSDPKLPVGFRSMVQDQLDLWPKQIEANNAMAKRTRRKIFPYWIVLLEKSEQKPAGLVPFTQVIHTWRFAWSRKWALDLARQCQSEGWTVVDIVGGSKDHIIHKFQGL